MEGIEEEKRTTQVKFKETDFLSSVSSMLFPNKPQREASEDRDLALSIQIFQLRFFFFF